MIFCLYLYGYGTKACIGCCMINAHAIIKQNLYQNVRKQKLVKNSIEIYN